MGLLWAWSRLPREWAWVLLSFRQLVYVHHIWAWFVPQYWVICLRLWNIAERLDYKPMTCRLWHLHIDESRRRLCLFPLNWFRLLLNLLVPLLYRLDKHIFTKCMLFFNFKRLFLNLRLCISPFFLVGLLFYLEWFDGSTWRHLFLRDNVRLHLYLVDTDLLAALLCLLIEALLRVVKGWLNEGWRFIVIKRVLVLRSRLLYLRFFYLIKLVHFKWYQLL